jgi:hypothetical protein
MAAIGVSSGGPLRLPFSGYDYAAATALEYPSLRQPPSLRERGALLYGEHKTNKIKIFRDSAPRLLQESAPQTRLI